MISVMVMVMFRVRFRISSIPHFANRQYIHFLIVGISIIPIIRQGGASARYLCFKTAGKITAQYLRLAKCFTTLWIYTS